ncbi:fatty acid desaturase, partial [Candidatus Poribacteria bacterium]|nr:fatty acid desaturase [Candidatus Poribacteria bacterium]
MKSTNKGLFIALGIIGLWGLSLSILLTLDVRRAHLVVLPLGMLCQTFLYTGLFITSHDAMHGSICPTHPRINNVMGALAVRLYALFSYRKLQKKHWEHHRTPASDKDPDFHDGHHTSFLAWYFHFMKEYLSWWQIVG